DGRTPLVHARREARERLRVSERRVPDVAARDPTRGPGSTQRAAGLLRRERHEAEPLVEGEPDLRVEKGDRRLLLLHVVEDLANQQRGRPERPLLFGSVDGADPCDHDGLAKEASREAVELQARKERTVLLLRESHVTEVRRPPGRHKQGEPVVPVLFGSEGAPPERVVFRENGLDLGARRKAHDLRGRIAKGVEVTGVRANGRPSGARIFRGVGTGGGVQWFWNRGAP